MKKENSSANYPMEFTVGELPLDVLKSDHVVCVDVDDTLVSWSPSPHHNMNPPHEDCGQIDIEFNGLERSYWTFPFNIESIKSHRHKGHRIVVWSGSGYAWAEAVVRALDLVQYVDVVMSKPRWLLDDMKPADFMPTPYWGAGDPGKCKLK